MSRTLCCIPRGGSHPCTACCCLRCPLVPSCPRVFPRVTALPAVACSEGAIWQGSAADRPACPALGYLPGSVRLSVVPPAVCPACSAGAALGYSPRGIRLLLVPPALPWVTCPAGCECCLSRPSRLPCVGLLARQGASAVGPACPALGYLPGRVRVLSVPPVPPASRWVTCPLFQGAVVGRPACRASAALGYSPRSTRSPPVAPVGYSSLTDTSCNRARLSPH